jgi:hypothetical protein
LDPKGHILEVVWDPKGAAMIEVALAKTEAPVEEAEEEAPPPRWELVECTCPDWCERDHEQD